MYKSERNKTLKNKDINRSIILEDDARMLEMCTSPLTTRGWDPGQNEVCQASQSLGGC